MDEDGYLYVEGRLDDVIVRGGENISPGEIEDVLREHPQVADVAVLGLPDLAKWKASGSRRRSSPRLDGAPSADELGAWVKARLRSTKTPEVWGVSRGAAYNETGSVAAPTAEGRDVCTQTAGSGLRPKGSEIWRSRPAN